MKSKKKVKLLSVLFISLFTVFVASGCSCSCTSSMCSEEDEYNIRKKIEKDNIEEWRNKAALSGMNIESEAYTVYANTKMEEEYLTTDCGISGTCSDAEIAAAKSNIRKQNNNKWLNELEELSLENEGYIETRSEAFKEYVEENVNELYESHPKACLVIVDDVDPQTGAKLEAKTWGDAWQTGLLEGLIVYPLAWLLSSLTNAFGGGGASQLFAILIAVLIIRTLMLTLNFKGQISTIKMQSVQGELSKLNDKLKDPNLTQQEKQAISFKMMDIYKKNDIHPFSSMLSQFISFPIFIAVWAAMNQTLAIRKGTLLGLEFGTPINAQVFSGNITAILLFALMVTGQVVTMKLSSWIKVYKEKKNNPNYVKPQKSDSERQMNMMMILMVVMVVMSGFLLPAALVIYWFLGSLFSIGQTLVFSTDFMKEKLNTLANRKKKAKVVKSK